LEIDAADRVAINCREFTVQAQDGVKLASAGSVAVTSEAEIRMRSAAQTFIDGDYVNLNCLDRTGYHDHVPDLAESVASDQAQLELQTPPNPAEGSNP
jgi:hypothetical protein